MLKMGFCSSWVTRVMSSMSSVSYKVKLNSSLSTSFKPERGLRQGDPLSPYLFILCADWLSHKLRQTVNNGLLEGVMIRRTAPSISHLFFAVDYMLLFRIKEGAAQLIKYILAEYYEATSAQQINYGKSEFVLSRNCGEDVSQRFVNLLSVRPTLLIDK